MKLSVDFSYCWINLVEAWYSLEQYIGLKEDKLSSTTVDFIRSEGNLETKRLYWFSKLSITIRFNTFSYFLGLIITSFLQF